MNDPSKRRRKTKALGDRALAGRSIATRTMTIHGRRKPVVISLGRPEPDPEAIHGDWRCPVRISGLGPPRLRFGRGIDAFQSLITALEVIRYTLEPHRAGLSWVRGKFVAYQPTSLGKVALLDAYIR